MLVVFVIGAFCIYAGIYTALTAISFYSDAPTGILPLMYNIQNYGRYPVNIYNKAIRFLLTWILPFAFVGVIPASYFLDRNEEGSIDTCAAYPGHGNHRALPRLDPLEPRR